MARCVGIAGRRSDRPDLSVDASLVGTTAADLMGELPGHVDGEVVAVGIVVVVDCEDGDTYTRVKCSRERLFEQVGLFGAALEVVRSGEPVDEEDDQ